MSDRDLSTDYMLLFVIGLIIIVGLAALGLMTQ